MPFGIRPVVTMYQAQQAIWRLRYQLITVTPAGNSFPCTTILARLDNDVGSAPVTPYVPEPFSVGRHLNLTAIKDYREQFGRVTHDIATVRIVAITATRANSAMTLALTFGPAACLPLVVIVAYLRTVRTVRTVTYPQGWPAWIAGSVSDGTRRADPPGVRVANELSDDIRAKKLSSVEQLPTITQLCERYDVSGNTVVAATQILEDEGLVIGQRGWGTFGYRDQP